MSKNAKLKKGKPEFEKSTEFGFCKKLLFLFSKYFRLFFSRNYLEKFARLDIKVTLMSLLCPKMPN